MNNNEMPRLMDPSRLGEEVRLTADLLRTTGEYEALLEEADFEDSQTQSIINLATEVSKEEVKSLLEQYLETAINESKINISSLSTSNQKEEVVFRVKE
jgi:hypothetical protein